MPKPNPGSHKYDIARSRLRTEFENHGLPDQNAERPANDELQLEHPPRRIDPDGRGAGPQGNRGTSRGDPSVDEPQPQPSGGIELRSAAFSDHAIIPKRYSLDGGNISPP